MILNGYKKYIFQTTFMFMSNSSNNNNGMETRTVGPFHWMWRQLIVVAIQNVYKRNVKACAFLFGFPFGIQIFICLEIT